MTARGVSTVVDVSLCLLLITASVLSFVRLPPPTDDDRTAGGTANVLGTSTATVNYSLNATAGGESVARTEHATLANLLAAAAVSNARVDGAAVSPSADGFERAVAAAVRRATDQREGGVQVRARWRPYRGAAVRGEVVVGDSPPPNVDVQAATLAVPAGDAGRAATAVRVGADGFDALADRVARATVALLFPRNETANALRAGGPAASIAERRYRGFAGALGASVVEPDGEIRVRRTNAALAGALADEMEADLRESFEGPADAARAVSVGRVTVTVRTWSR